MALALEPMPNYSSTPGGPHGQPLAFWAAWDLADRPRRIALLVDDCQEEYRPYADGILPNVTKLVDAFRATRSRSDGVCIAWSAWSRAFDDGIANAMDRWYGPRGLRPEEPKNAAYVFTGSAGMKPLAEIAPTAEEEADGWFYLGKHLDMFWTFDAHGASYLDEKLEAEGVEEAALTIANRTVAKVLSTDDVLRYLEEGFVAGEAGAVKGTEHPDGRTPG